MQLESPHLEVSVPASFENLSELIFRLVGADDPFAIVAKNELTFAQMLWTDTGFILEYQADSLSKHFRSERSDFTAQEMVTILAAYARDSPNWIHGVAFNHIQMPVPFSFRLGRLLGRMLGYAVAAFRPSSSGHG
jgi:hypothetical protein